MPHQCCTGGNSALLDASMADVDRPRARLRVACWREGKDYRNIGVQLGLIRFDDHDVIAAPVDHGLGNMPLGQEGIHCEPPAWPDALAEHGLYLHPPTGF